MTRRPISIALDTHVEAFMSQVEKLLGELEDKLPDDYCGAGNVIVTTEAKLRELRKRWLAEETARAR